MSKRIRKTMSVSYLWLLLPFFKASVLDPELASYYTASHAPVVQPQHGKTYFALGSYLT